VRDFHSVILIFLIVFLFPMGCSNSSKPVLKTENRIFLNNSDIEQGDGDKPLDWNFSRFWPQKASPDYGWSSIGRNGTKCLKIESDEKIVGGWSQNITLEPDGYYELSGWVKTENLEDRSSGVTILIPELRWKQPEKTQIGKK